MNKNLVGIIAGIGFAVATASISYAAYHMVKEHRAYLEKKENGVVPN